MLLFTITGNVHIRVYVTVSHYIHLAFQSVWYCFTLPDYMYFTCQSVCYCFTLHILYLWEYMLLFQDPVLVRGTVRTNLDPWSNHSDADIWSSIQKVAHCHF